MKYFFNLSGDVVSKRAESVLSSNDKVVKEIRNFLDNKTFATNFAYSQIIRQVVSLFKKYQINPKKSHLYDLEILPIKKGLSLTEKTVWGGVSLKKVDVDKDYIRKLLVIGNSGVLGFEYHKLKHERLQILEGVCLVIYSNHQSKGWKKGEIFCQITTVGDQFEFLPLDEHAIVAATNCVIEETSTNHLDDLIFIYKAKFPK